MGSVRECIKPGGDRTIFSAIGIENQQLTSLAYDVTP
jgi:hypothetical protein